MCKGAHTCPRVIHFRDVHEVSGDVPLILAIFVFGHKSVDTIVDVCGDVKLQTAMVLALC